MTTEHGFRQAASRAAVDPFLTLIEFQSPELSAEDLEKLRFVLNGEGVTHDGKFYHPSAFQYRPPAQNESIATVGTLRIDNVDRVLSQTVIGLTASPTLILKSVFRSAPDTIEKDFPPFEFFNISWDLMWMEGSIGVADDSDAPSVSFSFTPSQAPALYVI